MELTFKEERKDLLKKNYQEALKNEVFVKLIKKFKLTEEEAMKRTMKILDTANELKNCDNCQGLHECKNAYRGHIAVLEKDENGIHSTYTPCKYKKKEWRLKEAKKSEEDVLESARMKDIDVQDKKRIKVIKWLDNFYEHFDFSKNMKGLYLYGSFGSGKSFLISALLNELKIKKDVTNKMIYFPEILRELKSDWELYEARMKEYQTVDILCIDDIGAEKVSEWSRDEVLGTILQTRMNHNLTTFFTSNLSLAELEHHFLTSEKSDERIKARRIMERIKQLAIEMELISENRRNERY